MNLKQNTDSKTDYNFIKKIGDLTDDGVCVYNMQTSNFIYVNQNFLNIFEIQHEDLFHNSSLILQIISAEDTPYLKNRFEELVETGCINTTEFRLKFDNDAIKHLTCDVLILQNRNFVTAFVKDISMAKRHEDYLIKYTAQKDTMLDMLTHNLSGPLQLSKDLIASIHKGYSQNDYKNLSRLIEIMQENTQQCIDIVNDFLREEHFESLRTYVRKTRFDVMEKIKVTVDKMRAMNKDKTFVITSELSSLNINSDAVKFFQIIHNVLSNAIKFTRENGKIEIEVTEDETFYTICIKDNGVGISEALKPLVFHERIKGHVGLKGEKSSGLGLFIAKKLVEVMDGEIWFDNNVSEGASFYIKLLKE